MSTRVREAAETAKPFPAFTDLDPVLPRWCWDCLRAAALVILFGIITLLLWQPVLGLTVFWKILVPVLPISFALALGFWRNVCPLASFNQMPRRFGFTRGLTLSNFWKSAAVLVAMVMFFGFITLRHPVLNHEALAVVALLVGAITAAFLGGLFFKGRSGW